MEQIAIGRTHRNATPSYVAVKDSEGTVLVSGFQKGMADWSAEIHSDFVILTYTNRREGRWYKVAYKGTPDAQYRYHNNNTRAGIHHKKGEQVFRPELGPTTIADFNILGECNVDLRQQFQATFTIAGTNTKGGEFLAVAQARCVRRWIESMDMVEGTFKTGYIK